MTSGSRGAFILLEGIDRCGKTTQSRRLVEFLNNRGIAAELMHFPDRETAIGQMIGSYLTGSSEVDDHAVHLLFAANRWEKASLIQQKLQEGTSIIVDRYAYSGVAFSAAKRNMTIEWCKQADVGLPAPDIVLFLDLQVDQAKLRADFGSERYEKEEFQERVRENFLALSREEGEQWKFVDASQTEDEVQELIRDLALETVQSVPSTISLLWV